MKYSLDHYEKEQSDDPIRDARRVTDDFFRDNDQNQDGFISYDEFPGPKRDELWKWMTINSIWSDHSANHNLLLHVTCIDSFNKINVWWFSYFRF